LSVCSGIEAASVAFTPLGWKAVAFSEIEPFPCALLAHHYPDTPNWGDMTKFKDWTDEPIDLLCGGTPCQSFSVAGLRKGLADPRGNLMLTFGAIAAKYRPQWLVWENVPGVLSSNGGRDFGAFLGMLGQLGYGFAYRVLDAQHFGVPQRRRRVFVVGCLGDWRSAAAVLFERHSLSGHPAPRRQAGQRPTGTLSARTEGGGGLGTDFECSGGVVQVSPTLRAGGNKTGGDRPPGTDVDTCETLIPVRTLCAATGQAGAEIGADMAPTLNCNHEAPYIAHSLRGEGFDASEDGTGRGTPLVSVTVPTLVSNGDAHSGFRDKHGLIAFDTTQITSAANYSSPKAGDPCHPLAALAHVPAIASIVAQTLTANGGQGGRQDKQPMTVVGQQVRRLTPEECEALQGFPRGYTAIPHRGKPAADGPRYKALGNSWAAPCAAWIGKRIQAVALIGSTQEAIENAAEEVAV